MGMKTLTRILTVLLAAACSASAQESNDPFPEPIAVSEGMIEVDFIEFATLPDIDGVAARVMILVDEPGTGRMFVNDMRGPIYSVSYDGATVVEYVDISDARWGVGVQSDGRERGMQSFAFHPQFGEAGTPGYGRFYTWTDSTNTAPEADFPSLGDDRTHDTVLFEWAAATPGAATYDGGAPRELFRFAQPFANHNGGQIGFNTTAAPGDDDYGLLFVGVGDGGSGGDPFGMAQNLGLGFGKILRIDPLGANSGNGQYGIPAGNAFAADGDDATLGEIYAYGVRNPQRFAWDAETDQMYMSDIGQNIVEEISPVSNGANLGWNTWEGSFRFVSREAVRLDDQRGDANVVFPIAEWGQPDQLLQPQSAATGLYVYRGDEIPALSNRILFGDMPQGEIFHVSANDVPDGGQAPLRRVLLRGADAEPRTLLDIVQAKNREQGRDPSPRADLRFGAGPDNQVLILNKHDGVIRLLVP
jgi:hypothetical protein